MYPCADTTERLREALFACQGCATGLCQGDTHCGQGQTGSIQNKQARNSTNRLKTAQTGLIQHKQVRNSINRLEMAAAAAAKHARELAWRVIGYACYALPAVLLRTSSSCGGTGRRPSRGPSRRCVTDAVTTSETRPGASRRTPPTGAQGWDGRKLPPYEQHLDC